jgi:hypothetical protein
MRGSGCEQLGRPQQTANVFGAETGIHWGSRIVAPRGRRRQFASLLAIRSATILISSRVEEIARVIGNDSLCSPKKQ